MGDAALCVISITTMRNAPERLLTTQNDENSRAVFRISLEPHGQRSKKISAPAPHANVNDMFSLLPFHHDDLQFRPFPRQFSDDFSQLPFVAKT
ncbi:MAG: hypothetical protein R3D05_19545 [Dongiaceae bacterium]